MSEIPTFGDLAVTLDAWFDLDAFPDDAGNGWAVSGGSAARPIRRIGCAVNCSFEAIEDAVRQGADLLLTHHAARDDIEMELAGAKRERLRRAGIAHYVCHLPLDCAPFGTSATLCRRLGILAEGTFAEQGDGQSAGRWGMLPDPVSLDAFAARLSDVLGGEIPAVLSGTGSVHRVAVLAGAGGRTTLLEEARVLGCDTYVTGDGSLYTRLYARERGMNLLLGTHTATERPGLESLAQGLQTALPGIEIVVLRETAFE